MSYESPLELIVNDMALEMSKKFDSEVLTAIKKYHIDVNKDELIKALQYDRGQYEKGYQDGLKANDWISVEDRLPEPYETVAVIAKADCWSYCIGWLNGDEWVIAEEASEGWAVTHWMPLPEPPQEVTGDD